MVGSRGSVVPFFQELREQNVRVLPITDKKMTRFLITMEQSVDLVLKSLELGTGGEVFISRIPSCSIVDLAIAIYPEAVLRETGVRPGEKLHEVLLTEDEARSTWDYGSFFVVYPLSYLDRKDPAIIPGGERVPMDFRFTSEDNREWLDTEALIELLKTLKPHSDQLPLDDPENGNRHG